jgi:uncharacterized protein
VNTNRKLSKKDPKKLLFIINTPGQAYTWRPVIQYFLNNHREVKIIARNSGPTLNILNHYGLPYASFNTSNSSVGRLFSTLDHFQEVYLLARGSGSSLVMGFGVDAAITAARLRKPCILFIDDDHTKWQNRVAKRFSQAIITPQSFDMDLGKKQVRIKGYKELAYLHPDHFHPDPGILEELRVKPDEKYIIIRFNSFSAVHDIGLSGFSLQDKYTVVKTMEKYARVFIAAESELPPDLESYRLPIPQYRIHHALNYARMVMTDSGTISTESAVLGTPVTRYALGLTKEMGNFMELEQRYGLIFCITQLDVLLRKSIELVQDPNTKPIWAEKRQRLLAEKIDVASFLIDFIDNYLSNLNRKKWHQLQYSQL